MKDNRKIVSVLRQLLTADADISHLAEQSLAQAAIANPHLRTNPVRTLDDWYAYLERFLHRMPWQTMDIGEDASFFRRIDQNIGYFYYLIDQPLDALKNRGYWYPSLQYEPRIAAWLAEYNKAWGEYLSSPDSWNNSYYNLARTDARFELDTDRYESPDNWHSWNDFFARKLKQSPITRSVLPTNKGGRPCPFRREGLLSDYSDYSPNHQSPIVSPCDGVIMDYPVKTMSTNHLQDLLGESTYAERFAESQAIHIVLDVFDYHRFHAPCAGRVVESKIIPGIHAGGGVIVWDEAQGRYRYDSLGATGFQSLETRGILILDTPDFGYIALIAVGIQQVSSVRWTEKLQSPITNHQSPIFLRAGEEIIVPQGKEIGSFLFGGSDIIMLFEPGKAPAFEMGKTVKVGDLMAF